MMARCLIIGGVSFIASGLTLFSGFGLGTLLMPAFALFFPVDLSIALTGLVHLANNLFKLILMGRHADRKIALLFGLPAVLASFAGARLLLLLSELAPLSVYRLGGREFAATPVKLVIGVLLLAFALLECSRRFAELRLDAKWIPAGGLLSGFFGGLSGHQGALRSAFLIKSGLSKEGFIGTGVAVACLVDAARLSVYGRHFALAGVSDNAALLGVSCLSAFLGAFLGARFLEKTTVATARRVVTAMLAVISLALAAGLI